MPITTFDRLFQRYGALVASRDLVQLAGFRSADALRMAVNRGSVGFDTFSIPGRRGRFARTEDVASWLDSVSGKSTLLKEEL